MSNLVKFGGYQLDAARAEQDEINSNSGAAGFLKLAVGRTVVRFLPPPVGRTTPFCVTHQHYVEIPGAANKIVFNCPRMAKPVRACPVCASAERLRAGGNAADRERAYQMFPRRRVFCNVIDRSGPEKGPLVLGFGKKIHEALIALRTDEDAGGDFTHPLLGFDIVIERRGTGATNTEYKVMPTRANSPLAPTEQQMQEWIDGQHDLTRYAVVHSVDEIKAMLKDAADRAAAGGTSGVVQRGSPAAVTTIEADTFDAQFSEAGEASDDLPWG